MPLNDKLIDNPGVVIIDIDNILEDLEAQRGDGRLLVEEIQTSRALPSRPLQPVQKPSWDGRLERPSSHTDDDLSGYRCGR
jgi:hypothetical protein